MFAPATGYVIFVFEKRPRRRPVNGPQVRLKWLAYCKISNNKRKSSIGLYEYVNTSLLQFNADRLLLNASFRRET
jgi:hypothetical protein